MRESVRGLSEVSPVQMVWLGVRSCLFYVGFVTLIVLHSLLSLLVASWLPPRPRFRFVVAVNRAVLVWLRLTCGVRVELTGGEHLPDGRPFVMIANHQSEWETIYLQLLIRPLCTVLKQELLRIPFFGWALRLLQPIAIDRSRRAGAIKQLLEQGRSRLAEGIPVLIFPQGTRVPLGQMGKFNKGGAMLACSAGVPILCVAHNAGACWPSGRFIKYPGTVRVEISPLQESEGRSVDEVHQVTQQWLSSRISAPEGVVG